MGVRLGLAEVPLDDDFRDPPDSLKAKLARLPASRAAPVRAHLWPDRGLFVLTATLGFAGILAARLAGFPGLPTAVASVALIVLYALVCRLAGWFDSQPDRLGDNCYYLGFLLTLASLSAALIAVQSQRGDLVEALIGSFGVSLFSTIAGIALRVVFMQLRPDGEAADAQLERETQHLAARLRDQLAAAVLEFETFRMRTLIQLDAQVDHGGRVATQVGALVDRISNISVPPDLLTSKFDAMNTRIQTLVNALEDAAEADGQRQRSLARVVEHLDTMFVRLGDLGPLEALGREAMRLAQTLAATQVQSARLVATLGEDAAAMAAAQQEIRENLAHSTAALAQLQDALVEIAEALTAQLAASRA